MGPPSLGSSLGCARGTRAWGRLSHADYDLRWSHGLYCASGRLAGGTLLPAAPACVVCVNTRSNPSCDHMYAAGEGDGEHCVQRWNRDGPNNSGDCGIGLTCVNGSWSSSAGHSFGKCMRLVLAAVRACARIEPRRGANLLAN